MNINKIKNKILCEDALLSLKELPDNSVDLIITSPPYWSLRNYSTEGQLGLETTFSEYLDKLTAIFAECKRVLKKQGNLYINMGDSYASQPAGNTLESYQKNADKGDGLFMRIAERCQGAQANVEITNRFSGDGNIFKAHQARSRTTEFPQKCLIGQPWRLAIKLIDELGLIMRQDIIWAKQVLLDKQNITKGSAMPTSVKDRVNFTHEHLFHFVKSPRYYFNLDAIRMPAQSELNYERPRMGQGGETIYEQKRAQGIDREKDYDNAKRNKFAFNYRVRDAVKKDGQPQFKATEEEIKNYQKKSLDERMNDTKDKDSKQSRAYNLKKLLSEVRLGEKPNTRKIDQTAQFFQEKGSEGNTNLPWKPNKVFQIYGNDLKGSRRSRVRDFQDNKKQLETNLNGKNLPNVWQIGPEPSKEKHFAMYPQALLIRPILSSCPENGIILDPFNGAGTTCIVAKKLKRNYIGIDISPEYCEIAKKRIAEVPQSLF